MNASGIRGWPAAVAAILLLAALGPHEALPSSRRMAKSRTAQVKVNQADLVELMTAPGVGPRLAMAIIESRTRDGPFAGPDDLVRVAGIGPRRARQLGYFFQFITHPWPPALRPR